MNAKTKQAKKNIAPSLMQWRFMVVVGVIFLVFAVLTARAAYIQVINPDILIERGDNRTLRVRNTAVYRGLVTDRHGEQLAVSVPAKAVWAHPPTVNDPAKAALQDTRRWEALAQVLGQNVDELIKKASSQDKKFVYLQRQVSPAMATFVENLDIPGVHLVDESRRFYPAGEVTAHVIGFTDVDDKGIEGIEKLYDEWLSGTPDSRTIRRDGKGRQVEVLLEKKGKTAQDIQLTIDQRIQSIAYRELKSAVHYYRATSGSAVVVDVNTGEVLAMVNSPSYNPNNRQGVSEHRIRNRAITDTFEPGSSVKPLAVISALEFGSANMDTVIDTSPGWKRLGGSIVRDSRNYGKLDLNGIIQKSSNIGTSKLALSVPKEFLLDTYYNMGLMSDTGTNLIGEREGLFNEQRRWSDFELSTLSFGYGLTVTTMQLARMYAILGNGGLKQPFSIIKSDEQKITERVISQGNADKLLSMMESVVEEGGSGRKARVPGYRVAGKTGTSRKAVKGGYGEQYVNIFAGVAPVSDPQIAVVVLINEPKGDLYYGGDTAAPVFSSIMSSSLQLLNVTPDAKDVSSIAKREAP
ncbi:penicillin-binding transpeptidase domain-containing protein [Aliiglaciecola sp. LCG003]|uniref:penicillin-binding transpeptidase domain-containing protein n=1 Tax=Aliiglaciecola sp. LCG003 TaxID=3053655 RepID=UPI002572DCF2|nr:penicillin-binding transpeptidase domain-containing protein [Aliiglaciecola sp. LCG003]WJG08734.1 penicillin-binding transpeptidase domain-containing protein [Aliiglaciecola sp. LCG003]